MKVTVDFEFHDDRVIRVTARVGFIKEYDYFDIPPDMNEQDYFRSIEYIEARDSVLWTLREKIDDISRAVRQAQRELHL